MKRFRHSANASVDTGMSYWYLFKHGLGPGTMPKGVNVLKVIEDGWKDYVLLDKMLTTEELNEYEIKEATPPDELLAENGYSSLEETYEDVTSAEAIEGDVKMSDGTASNYQSFMAWYNSLTNYQKLGVDDYADEHNYPEYQDCTFGMLAKIMRECGVEAEEEDEWAMPKGVYHVASFGNDYDELQSSFDFKDPKQAIAKWVELQKSYPLNVMITGFQEEEENLRKYVTEHQDWYRQLSNKFNCPYDPEYIINECAKPVRPRTGKYAQKYTDQCHPFGLG